MAKRKGRNQGEANFISPLSIEECAYRLDRLDDEQIDIIVTELSSDKVNFTVELFENERLRVEAKGALRRWEGTLTRVDVQVKVHEGIMLWFLLVGLMLMVTLILIPSLALIAAHVNPLTWILIASGGIVFILGIMLFAHRYAPHDDTPRNLLDLLETTLS